jgi:exodeoxyribonuclease VII large subunit
MEYPAMSGGLFDQPLFDTPDKSRAKRGGAGKRSVMNQAPAEIEPLRQPSVQADAPSTQQTVPGNAAATAEVAQPSAADHDAPLDPPVAGGKPITPSAGTPPVRSVSEVNGLIGRVLQAQLPQVLRVRGEISNFNVYSKGHAFFKLKDQRSELPCMMWRNDLEKLRFNPADGLAVIAEGAVKLYEPQGRLQLYVSSMIPQGAGELELAFRQLCDKLRAEGLFAPERKKPIPLLPYHIVVITSATGDVFHDVITTAYSRFPNIHIMLFPVQVQGAPAAGEIVRAIELVNAHAESIGGVDLILLVRGGGSLEDLWAFNEETVARAIVQSAIPIATGIGHEPDVTIADLVADLRGPTPTGIAALVIPEKAALNEQVTALADGLARDITTRCRDCRNSLALQHADATDAMRRLVRLAVQKIDLAGRRIAGIEPRHAIAQGWRRLDNAADRLRQGGMDGIRLARDRTADCAARLQRHSPQIRQVQYHARLAGLQAQLTAGMQHQQQLNQRRLAEVEKQLELAGPMQVLQRGYSITTNQSGAVVKAADQVHPGDLINTRTASGTFGSVVSERG